MKIAQKQQRKAPNGCWACVSAPPLYEFATAICIWHVKYAKVMVRTRMFDIVRQSTTRSSQLENHKTIELCALEYVAHTQRVHTKISQYAGEYKYANTIWVFPYFSCFTNVPVPAQYTLDISGYQSTAVNAFACAKCLPHLVQMSNTCRRRKDGQTKWKIDEKPKTKMRVRSKTCGIQMGKYA